MGFNSAFKGLTEVAKRSVQFLASVLPFKVVGLEFKNETSATSFRCRLTCSVLPNHSVTVIAHQIDVT